MAFMRVCLKATLFSNTAFLAAACARRLEELAFYNLAAIVICTVALELLPE